MDFFGRLYTDRRIQMNKELLSLNFMYCMERFATQIYLTQRSAFSDRAFLQMITDASENESGHVRKLQAQIRQLKGRVYPFGFLFQFGGVVSGFITRLSGHRNLFKADTFVEVRAVRDYNSFLNKLEFDDNTKRLIRGIIVDEELHVRNWQDSIKKVRIKT
jgi:rubrerythrin